MDWANRGSGGLAPMSSRPPGDCDGPRFGDRPEANMVALLRAPPVAAAGASFAEPGGGIVEATSGITLHLADHIERLDIGAAMGSLHLVQALALAGCGEEAGWRPTRILSHRDRFGILFEDPVAAPVRSWGDTLKIGVMAGIIAATWLSQGWENVWCLDL